MSPTWPQLGIYSACYKLSILMTLFIQAFRYAGEPFFFAQAKQANAQATYAAVLNWFVIFCVFIFLLVTLYLDVFQYFVGAAYREGLFVVPVLLLANLLLGVYINLSIWYKLTDRTLLGAWVTLAGSAVTVALLFWTVPRYGYAGAAWAHLACYMVMVGLSYALGRRYYPVPYDLKRVFGYIALRACPLRGEPGAGRAPGLECPGHRDPAPGGVPGPDLCHRRASAAPPADGARRLNPPTPGAAVPIRLSLLLTLGLTAGLTPLAIDLYLPSIPAIATDLGSSVELVQLSVTVYLAVFALAQIVLGPLSDVLGRRATVLGGAGLFLAANLGCILAPDLAWLLGARAVQALGGAAVAVTIPALVRDLFGKDDYARVMGMVMMVMAAAPLLAPTLGSAILVFAHWRWVFVALAVAGPDGGAAVRGPGP